MSDKQPTSELSKTFFGRGARLAIWHTVMQRVIEPPEPFRLTDIYRQLPDAHPTTVGEELRLLTEIGAIVPMPDYGDTRSKYYRRLESSTWLLVQELAERTLELSFTSEVE